MKIRPGKYVEGVVIDGTRKKKELRRPDDRRAPRRTARKTILEGKNAKGELGAAQNGIEAISVDGLVLKNMWARNYESNGFFVHAADEAAASTATATRWTTCSPPKTAPTASSPRAASAAR